MKSAVALLLAAAAFTCHASAARTKQQHQRRRLETEYPTYAPTDGDPTYSPTGGDEPAETPSYPTYSPTMEDDGDDDDDEPGTPTYSPTGGDDDYAGYATATPTDASVVTTSPVTGSPVVPATTTSATTTATTTTVSPPPAPPACPPTLDDSLIIDAKATLYYAVVPSNPPDANNGMLCGRLEAENGDGWMALGISPNGGMVGGEAVLGIPNEGTVLKYELNGKGEGGVVPMSAERQTLRDVSISVRDDEITVMEFTKLLVDGADIPITLDGSNNFLHARGTSSLGYHSNGRISFAVDFSEGRAVPTNFERPATANDNGAGKGLQFSADGAKGASGGESSGSAAVSSAAATSFLSAFAATVLSSMA